MKALMGIKNAWYTLVLLLFSIAAYAQDKKVNVDIDVGKKTEWYGSPVVWVVGAAVFILLLVALLRGKKE
jgi:hypothetical protein